MLNNVFALLHTNAHYAGADVLWITDFRIPSVPLSYYQEMEKLQQQGTHFYGLQLGMAENKWTKRFDKMYQIEDIKMR